MKSESYAYIPYEEYNPGKNSKTVTASIRSYLFHWPLFVVSVLICIAMAAVYLHFATPGYTVTARLLIKDNEKGLGDNIALEELNLFKSNTLVENEQEVLHSHTLLKKVVEQLNIFIHYYEKGDIKAQEIYNDRPVTLIMSSIRKRAIPQSFTIEIADKEHFILKNKNTEQRLRFGTKLKNTYGSFILLPEVNVENAIGKKYVIALANIDDAAEAYGSALETKLTNKKATTIELSFRDNLPERGREFLNTLIASYNKASVDDKNRVRQSTLNFIDLRLASLTGELNSAEKNVENFKSSNGLVDISSESQLFLDNVKDNDAKLNAVQVQLDVIAGIENYVNSNNSGGHAPATAGITDPGLIALINQLIGIELKRQEMLETAPEGSPLLESVDRQIRTTRVAIRENVKGIKATLVASRNRLGSFNNKFEASIRQLPSQERTFVTIKRQQGIKEGLYVYLLQKREEAAVSYASTISDSRTIDEAYYGKPDSPNKMLILGLASMAGLILPIGTLFGRSLFRNRVESSQEVTEETSVQVLAELSYEYTKNTIVALPQSRNLLAEQFRSLRTNLEYIYTEQFGSRVTLITSGMPREGKSFVSINLAMALANAGRRTLLVEFDLRKPKGTAYLKLPKGPGLTEILSGHGDAMQYITPVPINDNLFALRSGELSMEPDELLHSDKIQTMFEELRQHFDEIVVDTPPLELVSDALILSKQADVNLYVVRQSVTHKSQLSFIREIYQSQRLKNLAVIFNGSDLAERYSGRYYGYYSDDKPRSNKHKPALRKFLKRF